MYDFCFTYPYAVLLAVGGLAGFLKRGSTASLVSGGGSALVLFALAWHSHQQYNRGQLAKGATLASLVMSTVLTYIMYNRYQASGKFMPGGLTAGISAFMTVFYIWNVLFLKSVAQGKSH